MNNKLVCTSTTWCNWWVCTSTSFRIRPRHDDLHCKLPPLIFIYASSAKSQRNKASRFEHSAEERRWQKWQNKADLMTHLQRRSSFSCSLDLQPAGGEENRRPCSRREEEAASSRKDPRMGCLDWNWKGGRREWDARSREEMELSCTHSRSEEYWGLRRERVGVWYLRETLMGLAQINIAQ